MPGIIWNHDETTNQFKQRQTDTLYEALLGLQRARNVNARTRIAKEDAEERRKLAKERLEEAQRQFDAEQRQSRAAVQGAGARLDLAVGSGLLAPEQAQQLAPVIAGMSGKDAQALVEDAIADNMEAMEQARAQAESEAQARLLIQDLDTLAEMGAITPEQHAEAMQRAEVVPDEVREWVDETREETKEKRLLQMEKEQAKQELQTLVATGQIHYDADPNGIAVDIDMAPNREKLMLIRQAIPSMLFGLGGQPPPAPEAAPEPEPERGRGPGASAAARAVLGSTLARLAGGGGQQNGSSAGPQPQTAMVGSQQIATLDMEGTGGERASTKKDQARLAKAKRLQRALEAEQAALMQMAPEEGMARTEDIAKKLGYASLEEASAALDLLPPRENLVPPENRQ